MSIEHDQIRALFRTMGLDEPCSRAIDEFMDESTYDDCNNARFGGMRESNIHFKLREKTEIIPKPGKLAYLPWPRVTTAPDSRSMRTTGGPNQPEYPRVTHTGRSQQNATSRDSNSGSAYVPPPRLAFRNKPRKFATPRDATGGRISKWPLSPVYEAQETGTSLRSTWGSSTTAPGIIPPREDLRRTGQQTSTEQAQRPGAKGSSNVHAGAWLPFSY